MPARALPNLGLQGFFDLGEDGWEDEMDLNLLKLSVLTQGGVSDKVASEPGSPTEGLVILLDETHGTYPNQIAVYDDATWKYLGAPGEGWLVYNRTANYFEYFNGSAWEEFAGGGGGGGPSTAVVGTISGTSYDILDTDNTKYLRFTNSGAKTATARPNSTHALPDDAEYHLRNVGTGNLTIVAGSGVTITPPAGGTLVVPAGGTVTLKRVATDAFDLFGLVVPV